MKLYTVFITEPAYAKIREQARYIAIESHAPLNAERWLERVIAAAHSLDRMPRRCAKAAESDLRSFEIRAIHIDGYLLLFTVNDEDATVIVINARHGRQLPRPEELPRTIPRIDPDSGTQQL